MFHSPVLFHAALVALLALAALPGRCAEEAPDLERDRHVHADFDVEIKKRIDAALGSIEAINGKWSEQQAQARANAERAALESAKNQGKDGKNQSDADKKALKAAREDARKREKSLKEAAPASTSVNTSSAAAPDASTSAEKK